MSASAHNSVSGTMVDHDSKKPRAPQTHEQEDAYISEEKQQRELGGRPAEGPNAAPPQKYQHNFFDPEVAHLRSIYLKIIGPAVVLIIVFMWITLPVFWGSMARASTHAPQLHAYFINRDQNGLLGQTLQAAFEANSRGQTGIGKAHLTWIIRNPDEVGDDANVQNQVIEEKTWAAVVVNTDATARLVAARQNGDSSYNPQSAISFYYNQGRNEIATNSYIVPFTNALLQQTLARFSANFTAQYLTSLSNSPSAATALQTLARAPQTVSQPFAFASYNLRPYSSTVATAVLLVGQIYVIIFAFIITMTNDAARGIIAPFLNMKSYMKLRLIVPLVCYIPLSFSYAMISLPFKLPFGAKYSYAGGFFIFWLFVYMGMAGLGLSTEAMITLLTPRFIAFFLLSLIIINVSVTTLPFELQPTFYKYGYGFPVFNLSQAVRTIIFNTRNHLGRNAGVLIAWIVLSLITVPLFTWLMRRKDINAEAAAQGKKAGKEKDEESM